MRVNALKGRKLSIALAIDKTPLLRQRLRPVAAPP